MLVVTLFIQSGSVLLPWAWLLVVCCTVVVGVVVVVVVVMGVVVVSGIWEVLRLVLRCDMLVMVT